MESSLNPNENRFQTQNKNPDKMNDSRSSPSEVFGKSKQKLESLQRSGSVSEAVDEYSAKVPSLGYIGLAAGAMIASAALASFTRKKELANFVGLWAPSFLILALYNKIVKMEHGLEETPTRRDRA